MKRIIIVMLVAVALVGCGLPSMNTQRATLRGGGDVLVTGMLARVPEAELDNVKKELLDSVAGFEKFLEDGNVATLTEVQFRDRLLAKLPVKYLPVANAILDRVQGQVDASGLVGPDNVKRLLAVLRGIRQGIAMYDVADRKKS